MRGSALEEVDAIRFNLGWAHEPFHVPEEVKRSTIPYELTYGYLLSHWEPPYP